MGTGWGQTPCSISTPYDDLTNVETAEHSFIQAELVNIVQPFLILYLKGQRQKKTTEASPKLRFILQVAAARLMAEDISPPVVFCASSALSFVPQQHSCVSLVERGRGKFVLTHQTPSWRSQNKNTGDGWIKRKPEEEEEVTKALLVSEQFYLIHNQAQAFPSSRTAYIAHQLMKTC